MASDLTHALVRPLYPSLYALSPKGKPVPDLAHGIEFTPYGVRITLARARWSDGSRITSRDVIASLRRARAPSGFARIIQARAISKRAVALVGTPRNWPRLLSTATFVLPGGRLQGSRGRLVGGLSWRTTAYRRGLKIVYARNRHARVWERPYLKKVTVFFYESESVLLDALRAGRVDVAVPPSTLNLGGRLDEMDVVYDDALGWESIWLDIRQSLTRAERSAFVSALDRRSLELSLIRDDGRLSQTLHPGPRGVKGPWTFGYGKRSKITQPVRLSVPSGDELLFLLQRAIQIQLAQRDIDVDLVVGSAADFYGPWRSSSPADVALLRSAGAPGLRDAARFHPKITAYPLAHVRTYLAWSPRMNGLEVNPTLDGPLWNMASWWVSPRR